MSNLRNLVLEAADAANLAAKVFEDKKVTIGEIGEIFWFATSRAGRIAQLAKDLKPEIDAHVYLDPIWVEETRRQVAARLKFDNEKAEIITEAAVAYVLQTVAFTGTMLALRKK